MSTEAPVQKRRRIRRGHVRTARLSTDAWQLVLNQTDPLHVILLSMTCLALRNHIRENFELWKRLFIVWEWKTGGLCVPNSWGGSTKRPEGVPPTGWQNDDFKDKELFNATVKKIMVLQYVKRCGLCGQNRRRTYPLWALSMRICEICCRANLISNRALYAKYGVALTTRMAKTEKPTFIEKCFGKVLFFIHDGPDHMLRRFSYQPCDLDIQYREAIIFFWEPHLRQVFDLDELYRRKQHRLHIAHILTGCIRRLRVRNTISSTFSDGVHPGFCSMKPCLRNAVLINLHMKQHIPLARRQYHLTQGRVHRDCLFHDTWLLAATKAHICKL